MVNGITAGLAGATNCGIPLTLRGVARGVTLVTAHTQDDSSLNWSALAQSGTTLVVYMGVAKLPEIRESLLHRIGASLPGCYVPALYRFVHGPDGVLARIEPADLFGQHVHPGTGGEVVRILRAAMQHQYQRHGLRRGACGSGWHIKPVMVLRRTRRRRDHHRLSKRSPTSHRQVRRRR